MFSVFNRPTKTRKCVYGMNNFLLNAFRSTPSQSSVFGGVMDWNDCQFSNALLNIVQCRQIQLKMVTGGNKICVPRHTFELFANLHDCIAANVLPDGILAHAKFIVFSRFSFSRLSMLHRAGDDDSPRLITDLPCDVACNDEGPALWVGSSNIGENHKHNAAVLVPLSDKLLARCTSYFDSLYRAYDVLAFRLQSAQNHCPEETPRVNPRNRYSLTAASGPVKVYFFPRLKQESDKTTDTIVEILQNVKRYTKKDSQSEFRISIVFPRWRCKRIAVAKALNRLYRDSKKKPEIRVICRSHTYDKYDGKPELDKCVAAWLEGCATRKVQRTAQPIHSKYILIDALYRVGRSKNYAQQKIVWIGSPNLAGKSIGSQWEILVKVANSPQLYSAFQENFLRLWNDAAVNRKHKFGVDDCEACN